jgi:arsenite/tail-anchored protein-transporting ATPase
MNPDAMPSFLSETRLKLLFFGGKGGVGKTTLACATALRLATGRPDQTFLLVSTDPAHSICDVLIGVARIKNLVIHEMNPEAALHAFKLKHEKDFQQIAERGTFLDQDDVNNVLNLSLPGMDELAAYLELADWLEQKRYDCIVVDTAPTGHTLRLLEMPQTINRWLEALDSLLAKQRYIRQTFTHDNSLDHLDRFLLGMDRSLKLMVGVMTDSALCRFVLIMLGEVLSIDESRNLIKELHDRQIPLTDLIVNRLIPENECPVCASGRQRQIRALKKLPHAFSRLSLWGLPLFADEPQGNLLFDVLGRLYPLTTALNTPGVDVLLPVRMLNPGALPDKNLKLLIFAGKGGVGKTTMACATAVRLQRERRDCKILLFSSDPAHSLSACLGITVKKTPTPILPDLDAQEMNAEKSFGEVRSEYHDELEKFLSESLPNIDITFDREVMEHLLDLAPPGLDEIMALSAVREHLDGGYYDVVVMDAAPSGHLIRLLELPEIIIDWLKQFFSLLLKYKNVMRLPHLSRRLVKLSQELKSLRSLLRDPDQTSLYAVTIPTVLAISKTEEMHSALSRLEIGVHALIINQVTPPSVDCSFCRLLSAHEEKQINRAQSLFPRLEPTRVFRQSDPGGIENLSKLGAALFK